MEIVWMGWQWVCMCDMYMDLDWGGVYRDWILPEWDWVLGWLMRLCSEYGCLIGECIIVMMYSMPERITWDLTNVLQCGFVLTVQCEYIYDGYTTVFENKLRGNSRIILLSFLFISQ